MRSLALVASEPSEYCICLFLAFAVEIQTVPQSGSTWCTLCACIAVWWKGEAEGGLLEWRGVVQRAGLWGEVRAGHPVHGWFLCSPLTTRPDRPRCELAGSSWSQLFSACAEVLLYEIWPFQIETEAVRYNLEILLKLYSVLFWNYDHRWITLA